ncbi:MAG: hypothetical protein Kow0090_08370 [Myxococcota bacterium]
MSIGTMIRIGEFFFSIDGDEYKWGALEEYLLPFEAKDLPADVTARIIFRGASPADKPFLREGHSIDVSDERIDYFSDEIIVNFDIRTARLEVYHKESGKIKSSGASLSALNGALKLALAYYFKRDSFFLHSSSVICGRKCAVFAGAAGSGKSTLALMFQPEKVVSDELTLIKVEKNSLSIVPTPVRHDSPCKLRSIEPMPLGALFLIKQSSRNRINPISKPAFAKTLLTALQMNYIPIQKFLKRGVENLLAAIVAAPCYELEFTTDGVAAELVAGLLKR